MLKCQVHKALDASQLVVQQRNYAKPDHKQGHRQPYTNNVHSYMLSGQQSKQMIGQIRCLSVPDPFQDAGALTCITGKRNWSEYLQYKVVQYVALILFQTALTGLLFGPPPDDSFYHAVLNVFFWRMFLGHEVESTLYYISYLQGKRTGQSGREWTTWQSSYDPNPLDIDYEALHQFHYQYQAQKASQDYYTADIRPQFLEYDDNSMADQRARHQAAHSQHSPSNHPTPPAHQHHPPGSVPTDYVSPTDYVNPNTPPLDADSCSTVRNGRAFSPATRHGRVSITKQRAPLVRQPAPLLTLRENAELSLFTMHSQRDEYEVKNIAMYAAKRRVLFSKRPLWQRVLFFLFPGMRSWGGFA